MAKPGEVADIYTFAAMFKILPDVDIAWSDVWLGAAATAMLFSMKKLARSGSRDVTSGL